MHDPDGGPLVKRAFEDLATGRFTKREVIRRATGAGLRTGQGLPLSPQTFGQLMRNRIYIGQVESPDCGVSARGDFEPLIDEDTFYRAQAVLDGRVTVTAPRQRNHPDFPLRGFVRCESCGRPLTGSWSKGRNGRYAYYHCRRRCRAVNVSKAVLEGAFVDELALLQPTPGYMRLVKDRSGAAAYELTLPIAFDRLLTTIVPGLQVGGTSPTGVVPEWTREVPGEVKAA